MTDRIAWGPDSPGYPECPIPPGTDCTVWFRGLEQPIRGQAPEGWVWMHNGSSGDIIAYQPAAEPDQARELLAEARGVVEQLRPKTGPSGVRAIDHRSAAFTVIEPPPIIARIDAYLSATPNQSDLLAAISTLRDTLQTALKLIDAIHDAERARQ